MPTIPKQFVIGASVVIITALTILFIQFRTSGSSQGDEQTASTTAATTTTQGEPTLSGEADDEGLPPEPEFVLPEGATAIDDYAFVDKGIVYMRSLVDAGQPLKVPTADPETFRRLQAFSYYSDGNVVRDCGASPMFTYYTDKKRPYFYQAWRAPEFRASQIDAMVGANVGNFAVTGPTTATDGNANFKIVYEKATATCTLLLDQVHVVES